MIPCFTLGKDLMTGTVPLLVAQDDLSRELHRMNLYWMKCCLIKTSFSTIQKLMRFFPLLHINSMLTTPFFFSPFCQIFPLWCINRLIYLRVLPLLLLCALRHVRVYADLVFLRLHGMHLLWLLPHAWDSWFSCCPPICPPHIWVHQVRVRS